MTDLPKKTGNIPDKPSLDGLDERMMSKWENAEAFAFKKPLDRSEVFSIDTPPPTVSGSLHVGSAFGFTHQDAIARYQRMKGRAVFFPMGWDDNGLPTERRVENYYGVRCDATLTYDANFVPPDKPDSKKKIAISRANFIELCEELTMQDEKVFEGLWRRLGISVDWSLTYTTIGRVARQVSQYAFLKNLERGEAYQSEAPTSWDVTFQTAVAQAEFEDREVDGAYHTLAFTRPDGEIIRVDTTRPELLPACVALIAHPEDERYQKLFGSIIKTPVFGVDVPVMAHKAAAIDKGTGIAMCCTFGDNTDVIWWRELDLPVKSILGRDGRLLPEAPSDFSESASDAYATMAGKTIFSAREQILTLLRKHEQLLGDPRPIKHQVKFYEKGDRPLEIVSSNQWYIKNGGRDEALREELAKRGRELDWHPQFMSVRYDNWVDGLSSDWLISRQRFFGVPIPLWYPIDADGEIVRSAPIVPSLDQLPVDPASQTPSGFTEDQRGQANGFIGDPDVMDTWATSSLTPQIAGGWLDGDGLFDVIFPMDLRPQGPEIIRTWLFDTVLRSHLEHHQLPWKASYVNGWVLDPDRKKMSKSKGNVVTPMAYLEEFGSDAFRYWACLANPGVDTAFSVEQIKTGRRLATKLLNASKLALGYGNGKQLSLDDVTEFIDIVELNHLRDIVRQATNAFEDLNYARALAHTEAYFWSFCDGYLELTKQRAYGDDAAALSVRATAMTVIKTVIRLLHPQLPFVTEEVWGWTSETPLAITPWPSSAEFASYDQYPNAAQIRAQIADILNKVRGEKSRNQRSMKYPVSLLEITDAEERIAVLKQSEVDLVNASVAREIRFAIGEPNAAVTLDS